MSLSLYYTLSFRAYSPLGKLYWDAKVPDDLKYKVFKLTCAPSYVRQHDKRFGILWGVKTGKRDILVQAKAHDQAVRTRNGAESELLMTAYIEELAEQMGQKKMIEEVRSLG